MYTSGKNFPDSKYYDLYTTTNLLTSCNGGICYGHGLSEVNNWYDDYGIFVNASAPWLYRGGNFNGKAGSGVFQFCRDPGGGSNNCYTTRSVMLVDLNKYL